MWGLPLPAEAKQHASSRIHSKEAFIRLIFVVYEVRLINQVKVKQKEYLWIFVFAHKMNRAK